MTTTVAGASGRGARTATRTAPIAVVAALGCGALAARPALLQAASAPVAALVVLFVALLAVGVALPIPRVVPARRIPATSALAVGVLAFSVGRLLGGGASPRPLTLGVVALNSLAAVAEEAWFRRLCFGLLAPGGTVFAIVGSSLLFAAVHVPIYGLWVLPLDVAAGLVLGWQRAATGSWAVPALTHVVANLLVVL
jgi:membrane protease YdiL (CAAX protease family)